jgi:hypothetical protein
MKEAVLKVGNDFQDSLFLDKIGILLHDIFLQKIVYFNRFIQENVRAQKLSGNLQFHGTF